MVEPDGSKGPDVSLPSSSSLLTSLAMIWLFRVNWASKSHIILTRVQGHDIRVVQRRLS